MDKALAVPLIHPRKVLYPLNLYITCMYLKKAKDSSCNIIIMHSIFHLCVPSTSDPSSEDTRPASLVISSQVDTQGIVEVLRENPVRITFSFQLVWSHISPLYDPFHSSSQLNVHLCQSSVHLCQLNVHLCQSSVHLYQLNLHLCQSSVHLCQLNVHMCTCRMKV